MDFADKSSLDSRLIDAVSGRVAFGIVIYQAHAVVNYYKCNL